MGLLQLDPAMTHGVKSQSKCSGEGKVKDDKPALMRCVALRQLC
jgi:hypothetical protein